MAKKPLDGGQRAIDLATAFRSQPFFAHALTNVGTERIEGQIAEGGRQLIEQGLEIRRNSGFMTMFPERLQILRSRRSNNMIWMSQRAYIVEGIAFTAEHDLIGMELYLRALRSQLKLGAR